MSIGDQPSTMSAGVPSFVAREHLMSIGDQPSMMLDHPCRQRAHIYKMYTHKHTHPRARGRRKGADGPIKDSCANILETREFVVNVMSEWFVESANFTCGPFPPDVDEMAAAGLTPLASERVAPPRVGESAVQFECRTLSTTDLKNAAGAVTTTLVVGEVVMAHVHEALLDDSDAGKPQVRFEGFRPVSRLGGNTYGLTTRVFDLPRPTRGDVSKVVGNRS